MSPLEAVIGVILIAVAVSNGQSAPDPNKEQTVYSGFSRGSGNRGQGGRHGDQSSVSGRTVRSGSGTKPASTENREGVNGHGGAKAFGNNKAPASIPSPSCFVMLKKDYPAPTTCRDEVIAAVLSSCPDDDLRYELDPSYSCLNVFGKLIVYQWNPSCNKAPVVQTGWIKVHHVPTDAVVFQDNITLDTSGLLCRMSISATVSFSSDDWRQ